MAGVGADALRVLVSRHARERHGALLDAAVAGAGTVRPVQWVLLDDQPAHAPKTVDAVFISRDITGLSTKHVSEAALAACYAVMRASPQLAWVHTHSAGADRPIYPELRARGVQVSTSAGANAQVVAASALAGLLALARRFPQLLAAQARREWAPLIGAGPLPPDLHGQTRAGVQIKVDAIGLILAAPRQAGLAFLQPETILGKVAGKRLGLDLKTLALGFFQQVKPHHAVCAKLTRRFRRNSDPRTRSMPRSASAAPGVALRQRIKTDCAALIRTTAFPGRG